ncbi:hypothetical protein [Aureivirga sp. CE67]|uniref:hypothetical protein n=1 Tax=Aureivirga sp. CE67 TaxID=1788983 RepID=UPI0018C95556|nr:hypothetical protein [Aureivirga sp. CE67]
MKINKIIAFFLILIIGSLLGGVYGILNDQITYTISPEYYTKFKFIQFNFENIGLGTNIGDKENPEILVGNPRAGAMIIGFLATWWMGLIIAILLGLFGFIQKDGKTMLNFTFKSFIVTIKVALFFGFIGFVYGKLFLDVNNLNWKFPNNLIDVESYTIVGYMHNLSYLGGFIGLIVGILNQYKLKKKLKQEMELNI